MKNYVILPSLLFLCIVSSSCTVLQWRKSDQEIQQKFKDLKIASEISYFKVDTLDLEVRIQAVETDEKKVNLVFFHGSPSSLSAWEGYLLDSSLRETTAMYAIDRPGYGYSNFGDEMTAVDAEAQLMSAIINTYKLQNVIAIGTSYGGPLAARVGFLNDKVKAVVMISPAIDPALEKDIWASRFTQWKLTRWLVPTAYRVAGDEKEVHAEELVALEQDWKSMTIPVVHIHGDDDALVPYENINFSKENFKNITIITVPEKGHEIAWKYKEIVIPHLQKLLDQLQE